jgi:hypothetical protein
LLELWHAELAPRRQAFPPLYRLQHDPSPPAASCRHRKSSGKPEHSKAFGITIPSPVTVRVEETDTPAPAPGTGVCDASRLHWEGLTGARAGDTLRKPFFVGASGPRFRITSLL